PSVLAGYGGSPRYVMNTNLLGTMNCLELARQSGAAMIFLSTSRVYPMAAINALSFREDETRFVLDGEQPVPGVSADGISESFPLEGARSLYGASKLCSELVLQEYLDVYGLQGIVNRCGVLTGPWQMGKVDQGVVVLWVARHVFGGKLSYIGYGGQGKQVRDMLHVDDLLRLILYEIDHLDALSGETFNVGGGNAVSASLAELTAACREVTGNTIDIGSVADERPADIPWYITDHRRITERTGWRPERDIRAIVEDVADWIAEHKEPLRPVLS
ncbi:MAG: GDP-mannose 4,6-dehydratase, partial [Candidatus Hydrogenedentes bacterium]|nr:GDP-mannose 4,6-dehydratase [Candidatus Hydrogenedentota bacterium]